jgi:uncharacterized membrane protein YdjX (TVP38/TMEM64 family)
MRAPLLSLWDNTWPIFSDRERCQAFISGFGLAAPLIFMGLQVFQVIFAPIPGELTGIIGGYLFGGWMGFFYSSIALTVGSWMSFMIGRALGDRFIRKMIPIRSLDRMDFLLRHQGAITVFILFIVPGFPKDYLCLFLGLSTLPLRVFILMASVGRMPGTLMLSFQGASLFDRNYWMLGILFVACLAVAYVAYRCREPLYRWIEKQNHLR